MKVVAFHYVRPASVDEAMRQLAADAGARVLAGGQTLIPMLAMRLARRSRVPDALHTGMQVDARDGPGSLRGQPLHSTRRGGWDL